MDLKYSFVYAGVNIFCLIVSLIILRKFTTNVGSEEEIRFFRRMTYSFMGFLVAEIIWALGVSGMITMPPLVYGLIKMFGTYCIPLMVYFWFWFAMVKYKNAKINSKMWRLISFIPMILLLIIYIISSKAGIVYKITESNEVIKGPGYNLSGLVDNLYGISIIVYSIFLMLKKKEMDKSNYIIQIVFILLCTLGGFIDGLVVDTPIMALTICVSFIYLFINLQEPQIFNDALTGLNNRRRANSYINEMIKNTNENNPLHLFMLDIDSFKQINDTKGHLEGDKALCVVGEAVAKETDEYRGFAARWGGDEFIVAIHSNKENFVEEFKEGLDKRLEEYVKRDNIAYKLKVSLGGTFTDTPTTQLNELINKADKELYKNKKHLR